MKEYRCHKCRQFLYSAEGDIDIEIVCTNCRSVNYPFRMNDGVGPRGQDFQIGSIDHHCGECNRMLLKSRGLGIINAKCPSCKNFTVYNTTLMRSKNYEPNRKFRMQPIE